MSDNLEANFKLRANKRRPRHVSWLLMLTAVLGTIVFHLVLGTLLLCYYTDASPLLALVTTSSRFNKWNAIRPAASASPFYAFSKSNVELFKKPRDVNIVAVVGYRNLERTSILDCYLQSNLVEHGGLLDQVVFVPETAEQMHLEWLHETVNRSDSYTIKPSWDDIFPYANNNGKHNDLNNDDNNNNNNKNNNNNNLYIKIDGDVVYIEENVIPTIVNTKLQHPKMALVSANVIHQPAVAKFHRRPGVVVPQSIDFSSWSQASASVTYEQDIESKSTLPFWKNVLTSQWQDWLRRAGRLPGASDEEKKKSPIHTTKMRTKTHSSPSSTSATERYAWVSEAQQHSSFLHHLERGDLQQYKFPLWKNPPDDISGAFVCATGADMAALVMSSNGEQAASAQSTQRKHTMIDGKGVVSHYDGTAGLEGLDSTGVLDRYRSYAEENVCPGRDS